MISSLLDVVYNFITNYDLDVGGDFTSDVLATPSRSQLIIVQFTFGGSAPTAIDIALQGSLKSDGVFSNVATFDEAVIVNQAILSSSSNIPPFLRFAITGVNADPGDLLSIDLVFKTYP